MISEVSDNEPDLTKNAQEVLNRRYLLHNEKGDVVETPQQLFKRVAKTIASAERNYDPVHTTQMGKNFFDQF